MIQKRKKVRLPRRKDEQCHGLHRFAATMKILLGFFCVLWISAATHAAGAAEPKPNVLFLAVDDMNDWIGCLAGTSPGDGPRAITPNLDKLAARGVCFTNAHTAGVFCAPSRAAIFSGQFASTTGCYETANYFVNRPEIESLQTSFAKAGYTTLGTGKLYHHPVGAIDQRGWTEFFLRTRAQRENGWALDSWSEGTPFPKPFPASVYNEGQQITGGLFLEWAGLPNDREEEMADTMRVNWAVEQLSKQHDEPFFLACGIYAPHYPHYCPQKYFDLYDPDKIELPKYKADDLTDLPPKIERSKTNRLKIRQKLEDLDALDDAIHGYLACISYADAMMGRVLDALEASPYADNTIVVLWSDHGYHLGEKHWGKHTLWERTSNVPFIWAGPGVAQGARTDVTVSLIDMYPTFVEMCDLPKPHQKLEGTSIAKTLKDPSKAKDRNVLLPYMKPGEFAVINRNWRYIRYGNDGEELYDVQADPHEWDNLAMHLEHAQRMKQMRGSAPKAFADPEPRFNARKDLVIEGESYRWELGAGNYTPPPKYLPYTKPPVGERVRPKPTPQ
ncbi:sulfatase [Haloferula helveola]|uniref:sulfatase n=2 Tax=Haloferula helveola TaxID=490095 RepID=UPI0030CDBCFD